MSLPLAATSRLFRRVLRTQLQPAATVMSKPAKHSISTGEQAIAMTVLFVTILGPSGYILAHLEDYKKK